MAADRRFGAIDKNDNAAQHWLPSARPAGQRGFSLLGMAFVMVLVGFVAFLAIRLVPVYLEYYAVADSIESLRGEAQIADLPRGEIQRLIQRRFDVNGVRRVHGRQVAVHKQGNDLLLELDYEARTPLLANIDAVVQFSKQVEWMDHAQSR